MKFNPGDEVIVVDGEYKGRYGTIISYENVFHRYFASLPELSVTGYFAFQESELEELPDRDNPTAEEQEDEGVEEIPVYRFGISQEEFHEHLEYFLSQTMHHIGDVGPEQALFGFQEFEGKTAIEVLFEIMRKLEEGAAMFTQAHILIGRIITALEIVDDQITA